MEDLRQWIFIGLVVALVVAMSLVMVGLPTLITRLLRFQRPTEEKLIPYECGMRPEGSARVRFSIKFYLIAMLFILFDIEAIFLYPWAAVHRWLGWFGLAEMGIFVAILLVGFLYIWKRGGFQWES